MYEGTIRTLQKTEQETKSYESSGWFWQPLALFHQLTKFWYQKRTSEGCLVTCQSGLYSLCRANEPSQRYVPGWAEESSVLCSREFGVMWWGHAVQHTRALPGTELGHHSYRLLHERYLPMVWHNDGGGVVDGPGAYCCIEFCPTFDQVCLPRALSSASGHSRGMASCSDGGEGGLTHEVPVQTETSSRERRRGLSLLSDGTEMKSHHQFLQTGVTEAGVELEHLQRSRATATMTGPVGLKLWLNFYCPTQGVIL